MSTTSRPSYGAWIGEIAAGTRSPAKNQRSRAPWLCSPRDRIHFQFDRGRPLTSAIGQGVPAITLSAYVQDTRTSVNRLSRRR